MMPGNHIGEALPNKNKKQLVKEFRKIDVRFLVFILGTYMISWLSYKDDI